MENEKLYEKDTGVQILLECETDVSDAESYKIYYTKPDKTTGSVPASLALDTTDEVYFVIVDSSFLNQSGVWKFWAWVYWAADSIGRGDPARQRVYKEGQ